jgi:hypothetical protein
LEKKSLSQNGSEFVFELILTYQLISQLAVDKWQMGVSVAVPKTSPKVPKPWVATFSEKVVEKAYKG